MRTRPIFYSVLFGAFISFFLALPGRQTLAPFDRDEARYMQASHQMDKSNDFIRIFFQETPRYHQPAGTYWLQTASLKAARHLGFSEKVEKFPWIYRVPSLISTAIIGALTAFMGALLFSPLVGVLASALLSVSILFSVECRLATPDSSLLAVILGMMTLLVLISRQMAQQKQSRVFYGLGYWGLMGVGLLIKGPIILLPGLLTPLALSLTGSGVEIWRRLRIWGLCLAIILAAPWYIAIYLKTGGAFFSYALGHNFFGKVTGGQETHGFPPGYYAVIFLLSFWPGSYFFVRVLPHIWQERFRWEIRFLLCWIVPFWAVFEMVPTKLPHYILPIYPAIALLTVFAIFSCAPIAHKRINVLISLYGVLWAVLSLALPVSVIFLLQKEKILISPALCFVLLIAFSNACGAIFAATRGRALLALLMSILGAIWLEMGLYFGALPVFPLFHLSEKAAEIFETNRTCSHAQLLSISYKEPSLVFLAGGDRTLLLGPEKAILYLQENPCDLLLLDKKREGYALMLAEKAGLKLEEIAQLQGKNYSNGRNLDLRFYKKGS